jgi:hypothetical protein
MINYTHPPWAWWDKDSGRTANYDLCKLVSDSTGKQILGCYGGEGFEALGKDDEAVANAHLIAAAADMHLALGMVMDTIAFKFMGEVEREMVTAAYLKVTP